MNSGQGILKQIEEAVQEVKESEFTLEYLQKVMEDLAYKKIPKDNEGRFYVADLGNGIYEISAGGMKLRTGKKGLENFYKQMENNNK